MSYLTCIGLDSPTLLDSLLTTMGTPAEVTIAAARGETTSSQGRLEQVELGQWCLVLAEPYQGPAAVSVHLWIPSRSIALEASILDAEGCNTLRFSFIHWMVHLERDSGWHMDRTASVRYAVAGESTWHSGQIRLVRNREIELSGPVALLPGTDCAIRLVTDAPLPVFLRGSCGAVRVEGPAYVMDVSCNGLSAQEERHLLRALGLAKDEPNE